MTPPLKTHCVNGHPFDEENTRVCRVTGRRKCRACQRASAEAAKKRRRAGETFTSPALLRVAEWVEGSEYDVLDCGYTTPCWVWKRGRSSHGYGVVYVDGQRKAPAHRLAYERVNGVVPSHLEIHHRCENPPCINVAHLAALEQWEHLGEHGRPVLGPEAAREVRRRVQGGESMYRLARVYGVAEISIRKIVRGESYAGA